MEPNTNRPDPMFTTIIPTCHTTLTSPIVEGADVRREETGVEKGTDEDTTIGVGSDGVGAGVATDDTTAEAVKQSAGILSTVPTRSRAGSVILFSRKMEDDLAPLPQIFCAIVHGLSPDCTVYESELAGLGDATTGVAAVVRGGDAVASGTSAG